MFSLSEDNSKYKTVVFDVIRIFFGEYKWEDLQNKEYPEIKITVIGNKIKIELDNYCLEEFVENSSDNNVKRVIKKLLYILINKNYSNKIDSWGIMTGIRPTKIVHRMIDQGLNEKEIFKNLTEEYLVKKDKANLILEITKKQRDYFLSERESYRKIAIYISIPFCPSICSYCTFGSYLLKKYEHLLANYLDNLIYEIKKVLSKVKETALTIDKVYIGGGTPSILNAEQLERLLKTLDTYITLDYIKEFSFEAGRPDTIDAEKLKLLKNHGVNRISINPQIMKDSVLKNLGRTHLTEDIFTTYKIARDIGFEIINMDLIMGIENSEEEFYESLYKVINLNPENITIHSLAFKRKSKMKLDENKIQSLKKSGHFDNIISKMRIANYEPYYLYKQKLTVGGQENIGFAKKGKYSAYNIQMIEERQVILGFGVGATSKLINQKDLTLENVFNPKDLYYYNDKIEDVINKKIGYIENIFKEFENGD